MKGSAVIARCMDWCAGLSKKYSPLALGIMLVFVAFVSPALAVVFSLALFTASPSKRMAVMASVGIAFAAAFVAHGIEYKHAVDMTRWMTECSYYEGKGLFSIYNSGNADHNGLLLWNFACWAVGNSGDLYLLQSIAAFVGYGLMSWLMLDKAAEEKTPACALLQVLLLVFLAVPTQAIVCSVRSTIGCIMCSAAFYTRKGHGLKESLPGFAIILLACLLHSSMVLVLAVFVAQPLIERAPVKTSILLAVGIVAIVEGSVSLVSLGLFNDVPLLGKALEKAAFYTTGTEWDQQEMTKLLPNISHVLVMLFLILLYARVHVTGQKGGLLAITLAMIACVIGMELTLVNVGNRFRFIPIILGSMLLLNNQGREAVAQYRWVALADKTLIVLALAICLISMRSFIPSFNWTRVLTYIVLNPLSFI